jgi:hypothetical protein
MEQQLQGVVRGAEDVAQHGYSVLTTRRARQ